MWCSRRCLLGQFNDRYFDMNKKGRYGHFIGGLLTIADFIILNIIFILMGLCEVGDNNGVFYTKHIWFALNVSLIVAHSLAVDIHRKRVVYADKVVINTLKLSAYLTFGFTAFQIRIVEFRLLGRYSYIKHSHSNAG